MFLRSIVGALVTSLLVLWMPSADAAFPEKPIRILVPFPVGGTVDTLTRQFGEKIGRSLKGANVVVENRPGAGGTIAAAAVAQSPADGYTLFMGTSSTLGISVFTQKGLPYSPTRDFTPIALLANATIGIYVNPAKTKVLNLGELVALARKAQKPLNYGSPGPGTAQHLAAELLFARTGVKMTHIPYKGTPPSITDLIAGHVDVVFGGLSAAAPLLKSGKLMMVAVAGNKRSRAYPQVAAASESLAGYDAPAWIGLVGPRGLDRTVVELLQRQVREFANDPQILASLAEQGLDLNYEDAATFSKHIVRDMALWEEAVKAAGLDKE